jgi:exosortase/archaeosortase family protein
MQLQESKKLTPRLLVHAATRNAHRRYISLACLVLCIYAVPFFTVQFHSLVGGASSIILNFGFMALAARQLRRNRQELQSLVARSDDRFLGYSLLLFSGVLLIAFHISDSPISLQALAAMMMVIGIAMSTWGLQFFQRFWAVTGLVLISLYADLLFITIRVAQFFTSENLLEQIMATFGSWGLQLLGFKATAMAAYVQLPEGAVEVASGCSGFDMALATVGIGFLIGQFMDVSWKRIGLIMFAGWSLALIFNVPRIMLLAIASVYWGKESFEFWHGPIGGQIFSGILFTVYYYLVMWIIDRAPRASHNS